MQKWKITQIFVNLPPQKQVVAGLTFTIFVLSSVIVYYESVKIPKIENRHAAENKINAEIIKSQKDQNWSLQNRYLDFMEREINTRVIFRHTIDSLKTLKKQ